MKVAELFERLSFGELSGLSIGNDGNGSIREEDVPKVVSHVNSGMLELHSMFLLSEKELILEMVAHITNYHLIPKFAESYGGDEPWPYIKDLPDEKFIDEVIRVLTVHNSHNGYRYPLNDTGNPWSLFTPTPQTLQVPKPLDKQALSVTYQARHPLLVRDGEGVLDQNITLPFALEGALQSFVAYKIFSNMGGQENTVKGQEHLSMFTNVTGNIEARDLVNSTVVTSHTKLEDRGFI